MPISASNVLLYSPSAGRGVRVGIRYTSDGRKERYCKVTGASLGAIGPVKSAHTTKAQAPTTKAR
jgi:large subunit ribosomal protein L24